MKSKSILVTVFSGFNYGSSLQALASKMIICQSGLDCELVKLKSVIKGRDIRFKKLVVIFFRSLLLLKSSSLKTYQKSYNKTLVSGSQSMFFQFTDIYLQPKELSWSQLKHMGKKVLACFSGSDQIWNSSTLYVDPLYYLRFVSSNKRIALSPSFGRDFIASYNQKKIAKWISEYSSLSVREDSGVKLIKDLTGKDAEHLLDPTLIIKAEQWMKIFDIKQKKSKYILAYFLDEPSVLAKKYLQDLKMLLDCEVIAIPYEFQNMNYCDKVVAAGPKEFVDLVVNAQVVCTDSFHGTAFAINMHVPFFTFERDYGTANKQSERVMSILRKTNLQERYQPQMNVEQWNNIDFCQSEFILNGERQKACSYVNQAIRKVTNNE